MLKKAIDNMYYDFVNKIVEEIKQDIVNEFDEEYIESFLEVEYNDSFDITDEEHEQHDEIVEYIEGILWDSCFSDNEVMCEHILETITEEINHNFRG